MPLRDSATIVKRKSVTMPKTATAPEKERKEKGKRKNSKGHWSTLKNKKEKNRHKPQSKPIPSVLQNSLGGVIYKSIINHVMKLPIVKVANKIWTSSSISGIYTLIGNQDTFY